MDRGEIIEEMLENERFLDDAKDRVLKKHKLWDEVDKEQLELIESYLDEQALSIEEDAEIVKERERYEKI